MSPTRCHRCLFPPGFCLCPEVPRIRSPFPFLVLRHASERVRLSNTARWAALALEHAEIRDHGVEGSPIDDRELRLDGAMVLFPSPHRTRAPARPPRMMVVLDGTWQQARRMLQRIPPLRALPRLSLETPPPGVRLRRPPVAGGMSTIEAMAGALAHHGEHGAAQQLLALHARGVERVLRLKGMWQEAAS